MTTGKEMAQYWLLVLSTLEASTNIILLNCWDDRIGSRVILQCYYSTECLSTDYKIISICNIVTYHYIEDSTSISICTIIIVFIYYL